MAIQPQTLLRSLPFEMLETVKLAAPMVVARAGLVILVTVDTMMIGRYAADELAVFGLGVTPQIIMMLTGIGLTQGVMILAAQAIGAGEKNRIGAIWRAGAKQSVALGLMFLALSMLTSPVLKLAGQPAEIAEAAGRVSTLFGVGLVPMLVYVATSYVLESSGHARIGIVFMVVANVVNLGLDYILVFGLDPIPPLGAAGAITATTAVRFLMMVMAITFLLRLPERAELGLTRATRAEEPGIGKRIRKLGYPLGLAQGMDVGAYRALAIIAFAVSPMAMAAWEVFNNLIALVYMTAVATSAATSIRVGRAVGQNNGPGILRAGMAGGALEFIVVCAIVWTWVVIPEAVGSLYVKDADALALLGHILPIGAIVMVGDCLLGVFMGGCRGAGDTWTPARIQIASLWLVAIPVAAFLNFATPLGLQGLAVGLALGLGIGAGVMIWRFTVVAGRPIARA